MTIAVTWQQRGAWRRVVVALLAMGVPVGVGFACAMPRTGLLMGIGAVLLGESENGAAGASAWRVFVTSLAPAWMALAVAFGLAMTGCGDVWLIAVAMLAGLAVTHARTSAVLAVRFVIHLVLAAEILGNAGAHRDVAALALGLGVLWNVGVRMVLRVEGAIPSSPQRSRKRGGWPANSVRSFRFWQYAFRIGVGLSVASVIRHVWPGMHLFWAMLTVAMLTMPVIERPPTRIRQRLSGTFAGVAVAGPLLAFGGEGVHLLASVFLACALPWARRCGYLWQTMVSTPLILLVVQRGHVFAPVVLAERLGATLLGGVIVLALNGVTGAATPPRD